MMDTTKQSPFSGHLFSIHSSIKTLLVPFGCKKHTNLLSAPSLGISFNSVNPSVFNLAISSTISATSSAIWWIPSPFFSMNLAMTPSCVLLSNSSILVSPFWKKAVFIIHIKMIHRYSLSSRTEKMAFVMKRKW